MKALLVAAVLCATLNAQTGKAGSGSVGGTASLGGTSQSVVSIAVKPSNSSQSVNSSLGFSATALLGNGLTTSVTKLATWASSNQAIAKIDTLTNTQAVTCVSAGTAQITATFGLISGSTFYTCTALPPPPPPTLLSIAVTPTNPTLGTLTNIGLIAIGTYSDGSIKDLTDAVGTSWATSNSFVASLGPLTSTQEQVNCLTAGTSTITAGSGSISGTTLVTCFVPIPPPPVLVSIVITPPNPSLIVPNGAALIATGIYSDGSTKDLTALPTAWLSASTSVATLGAAADPQPVNCVGQGSSLITATSGSVVGQTTISCTNPPPPPPILVSIAVNPSNASISVGAVQGFTATGTYSDGSTQDVTAKASWLSGTPAVAVLTGLTTTENATCLKGGSSSISAAIGVINNNVTLTCNAVLTSITVTPQAPQINVGTSQNFIATCNYNDGSSADCTTQATWTSGTPSHATIAAKADPQPVNCILAGTSTINAALGAISGNSTLTCLAVGPPPPTLVSLAITPSNPTVNVGSKIGLIATCTYSDSTTKDCTISQGTTNTSWSSGTPAHVTVASPVVDPELATCVAGGTSLITATNGSVSGTTTVTCQVPAPTLVSISVTPLNPNQFVGSAVGLTATCTYSDSTTANCTTSSQGTATVWTSSNIVVATIGTASTPQNVNCVAAGTSTIKAAVGVINGTTTLTCQAVIPPTTSIDQYCAPGNVPSFGASDAYAQLPQTCYYTNPSARPTTGTVRAATAATWNSVWALTNCDDVVELAPGSTITGSFVIPSKVCAAGHYRTLRVQNFSASFPVYGGIRKVSPHLWGVASLQGYPSFGSSPVVNVGATIQSTGTGIPLTLATPMSGLQVEGVKITRTAGSGYIARLIKVEAPNFDHIIFDSVWCAGTANDETQRCMIMDGISYLAWINFMITDMHCISGGSCSANQALSGGFNSFSSNQDCTWKIVNGYMTSADNTTLGLGGGAANTTPCDIEFRLNFGQKLQGWNPGSPTYFTPKMFIVKQSLETKNSNRMLIEGNVFDGVWAGFSQVGSHILLTPKNQTIGTSNVCPNCFVTNTAIRFNFFTTSNNAVQIANVQSDAGGFATAGNSYSIHDNIFENLNYSTCYKCSNNSGGALDGGALTAQTAPLSLSLNRVFINHNDYIPAAGAFTMGGTLGISGPVASSGRQMTNYTWTNNLILKEPLNNPGSSPINNPLDSCSVSPPNNCFCPNSATPSTILAGCFTAFTFGGNALVNGASKTWPGANCTSETSLANIFVNYNGGFNGPTGVSNYLLKTTSLCHNSALDGSDPGPNIPKLANQISGVGVFQ